ncbi:MAG: radical SAM protein [Candidatus Omnitrophota bacterium]
MLEENNLNRLNEKPRHKRQVDHFLINKEINNKEILERRVVLESRPSMLGIIITDWCNLSCIMCPDSRRKNQHVLSASTLRKINELLPYLEKIDWQGGEFFHLDYVKDMFLSFKKYPHVKHAITTNGLLLNKEWIELLFNLNTVVTFSIDSPRQKTYEYIRQGGSFNELIARLNLIIDLEQEHKKRLERYLTVVVMKSNYLHLTDFVEFAKKYRFSAVFFTPVKNINSEENIFKYINKDIQKHLNEVMSLLKVRFVENNIELKWTLPNADEKLGCDPDSLTKNKKNLLCDIPWRGMFICADRNGNIFPDCWCSQPVGNILENTLLEVWNNAKMQEYRKKISSNDMEICSECYVEGQRIRPL